MSYCSNCGNEIAQNSKFCMNCGMPVNSENSSISSLVEENKNYEPKLIDNELMVSVVGSEKRFSLCGKELVVSQDRDIFNSYRANYWKMAKICADNAVHEYLEKIHNIDDFLQNFLDIYDRNLEPLTKIALNILVGEDVYTITHESFMAEHKASFRSALADYDTMVESWNLTIESNKKVIGGISNIASNIVSNKLGANTVQGGFVNGMISGVAEASIDVTPAQKAELYNRITPYILFNRIFNDYWSVYLSLIFTLNKNGKNIYWPTKDMATQANNMFSNISSPNFNQEKIVDVLFDIIEKFPYNKAYYEFMKEKFAETDEVNALICYYGCEFSETVYSEAEYPKIEITVEKTNQTANSNDIINNLKSSTENIFNNVKKSSIVGAMTKKFGKKF